MEVEVNVVIVPALATRLAVVSVPATERLSSEPTEVMFAWAGVCRVPYRLVDVSAVPAALVNVSVEIDPEVAVKVVNAAVLPVMEVVVMVVVVRVGVDTHFVVLNWSRVRPMALSVADTDTLESTDP